MISGKPLTRRRLLKHGLRGAGGLGLGAIGSQLPVGARRALAMGGGADTFGPLQPADANGLMLPPGFSSRIVARADEPAIVGGSFNWHRLPDGGAVFPASGGGWVYVSNSERGSSLGGVGALVFDGFGNLVDAYSILDSTNQNCAGGPTPWNTWLSCEERQSGRVWECDPFAPGNGVVLPALGTFHHEAAAVDSLHQQVYLTEDRTDSKFYRVTPTSYPDLSAGSMEVMEILDPLSQGPIVPGQVRPIAWHPVPEPNPSAGGVQSDSHLPIEERAVRYQVPAATVVEGGEGCWYDSEFVYFTTKYDTRVWALDTVAETVEVIYERNTSPDPELSGVDNVTVTAAGDVLVAEDGGNQELVALTLSGDVKPIMRIVGHSSSEVTGPALTPDGTRLYFSSQRGPVASGANGITYELTGPFLGPTAVPTLGGFWAALLAGALAAGAAWKSRDLQKPGVESTP